MTSSFPLEFVGYWRQAGGHPEFSASVYVSGGFSGPELVVVHFIPVAAQDGLCRFGPGSDSYWVKEGQAFWFCFCRLTP